MKCLLLFVCFVLLASGCAIGSRSNKSDQIRIPFLSELKERQSAGELQREPLPPGQESSKVAREAGDAEAKPAKFSHEGNAQFDRF